MIKLFSFLFFTLFICSCNIYNPAEPTPAYIHIEKINLTVDGSQGTSSNKISDAWVYIDDQLMGCYEMPITFPVLENEGSHALKIKAGIKVNGIAATRAPYPFYKDYNQTINIKKGETITITPTVTYMASTVFDIHLMENFESAGTILKRTNNSDTTLQIISSPGYSVYEGSKSAIAYVDNNRIHFECATIDSFPLPTSDSPIFLEFNYKCNYNFFVGIIAYGTTSFSQVTALGYNPSSEWNKAYLYLTPTVSSLYAAINYRVFFGMLNVTGTDSCALLLDNIKLLHY